MLSAMKIEDISKTLMECFGEDLQIFCHSKDTVIEELLTDSRNHFNPEKSLFFAIRTKGGNDGHVFMKTLYEKGVRNFICEYLPDNFPNPHDANLFIVPSTLAALSALGKTHRHNAREVVAITGSRGKTTVKEMIFQLMEPLVNISRSPRSYNSKIGVPLSLWLIAPSTELAIIEAGISRKNEMKPLADTIEPDVVIFTNIGDAHAQGFDSREEKSLEKAILATPNSVKKVIYPLDYEELHEALTKIASDKDRFTWSLKNPEADLFISREKNGFSYSFKGERFFLEVDLRKDFDIENIASSLAFMLNRGMKPDVISERFRKLHHISTRLNVSEGINGCSLILDSYTSDLSSLLPAIDFMARRKMPWQTMTLVLSDLHFEGRSVDDTYRKISEIVKDTGISRFIGIGKTFVNFKKFFGEESLFFKDVASFLSVMSASDFNDEIILLKSGPEFDFKRILEQLEARKHETVLEVNLDALLRNFNYFRSKVPSTTGIVAMVKASGYGAGSYEIAKTLQDAGTTYLAVAALDEGIDLRNNGIVMPIMVMNPRAANYRALFNNRLEPVVYSKDMLHTLIREAKKYGDEVYPVHIKLDTGMHRMGFTENELDEVLHLLKDADKVKVASIFSHLATADCLDMDEFTFHQLERFERMSSKLIASLGYPVKRHILNSAGILRFPAYHYELVRLGIGLYGANTLPESIEQPLANVSTLRSVIICIRDIEEPETVGYSRKGKITRRSRIATVPIGYADGMNRKFGNGAVKLYVNGKFAPTVGNICMDATMIDVTDIECREGDSVEIFGENASLQTLADTLDTIPYEILTSVSPRVKRIYYRE